MGKDSKQFTLTLPVAISDAISANYKGGIHDFIRKAAAEKLARDFGLTVSPVLTRAGQGRRTDLERFRELEKKLAPYGGAWEIIRTGKGYEETAETLKELSRVEKDLIATCDRARRIWERAEKQREAAREAARKLLELQTKEEKEQERRAATGETVSLQERLKEIDQIEKVKKQRAESAIKSQELFKKAGEAAGIVPRKHAKSDESKASDGDA